MGRLFTSAVGRDPIPAPGAWIERNAIRTHPDGPALATPAGAGGKSASASLHDRLFAAWRERDWNAIAAIGRAHLEKAGLEPRLDPIAAAAIAFFRPSEVKLRPGDAEHFLDSFPEGRLNEYLDGEHERQRGRLADDALALQCLGMLGAAPFDYIGALRALEALSVAGRLRRQAGGERRLSPRLIDGIGTAEVLLPHWGFKIDVCRRSDSGEGWPESPLERKIAHVARRQAGKPSDTDCDCTPREPVCTPQDPCCAKVNYFIADLLELRDWTHRYKAGDLAYIEVVAAGETRSREHEMKRTREQFSETETSDNVSERRDFQVTDRSSLKREIERQQETSVSAEASTSASFGAGAFSFSASASASFARSSSEATKEAQEKAVETVKSAVSEIEKQTRTLRSERITTEEIEKNLHAFENGTIKPLVTKYFWVTQERRAQLYSYGKQLLAEFIVPEPARLYERMVYERREAEIDDRIKSPWTKPGRPELDLKPADLGEDNYEELTAFWDVKDAPAWPPTTMQITRSAHDDQPRSSNTLDPPLHFDIPAGYEAFQMSLSGTAEYQGGFPWSGSQHVWAIGLNSLLQLPATGSVQTSISPRATGPQDVNVHVRRTRSVDVDVTLHLARITGVLEGWQTAVFNLIKARYEQALAAYAEYEAARDKLRQELIEAEKSRNPFFNREFERTELKRAVIYLMCQDFSVDGAMIRRAEPCGLPEIDRGAAARKGYEWYFWDRLIDWKHMAYAFFDYFWNPMCDWPRRFDPDEPDALFKAFRRAGYARVLVPVSPAMHADFLWYVTTHQKWGPTGKPPLDDQDPRWRNVVYELEHANASAMTAREGHIDVTQASNSATIKGSDRYWTPTSPPVPAAGSVDTAAIALDIDREIYIDGEVYLIATIVPSTAAGAPQYDPTNPHSMWWDVTLDRPYEGTTGVGRLYAMGAQAIAPVFSFDVPTELTWAGDHDECLPTYPLPACPS